jgi:Ca2+-binding RTX toxin-like protein
VIQGDGTIGLGSSPSLRGSYADSLAAAQLSLTRTDGSTVAITGFTVFGANRGTVPTALADFGFTMDPNLNLMFSASFEGLHDGDDYIEGNGGNDVIFGNRGQDDIVGGSSDLFGLVLATQRPDGSDLIFGGAGTDIGRNDIGDATTGTSPGSPVADLILNARGGHAHDADTIVGDNGRILRLVGVNAGTQAQRGNADSLQPTGVSSTGGFLNYNFDIHGSNTDDGRTGLGIGDGRDGGGYGDDGNALTYDRIVVRGVSVPGLHARRHRRVSQRRRRPRRRDEIHGESGDDQIHGLKGNDVLFGDGQDDDLIGGYGNDWISGGTGNDGVIGDDGRIMTSRNATAYGEALHGVARLLPDNGDTRSFNGNMMNEAIATPGSIQQAMVNVADEMKKAVNITPFSFDPKFIGNADEFTSTSKKTIDYLGRSGATNADDVIFGGLGSDWLHGGSGDDAISGGEALTVAYTQVYDANGALAGVTRSDWSRPYNSGDMLRFNPDDPTVGTQTVRGVRRVRAVRRVRPAAQDHAQQRRHGEQDRRRRPGVVPQLHDGRRHFRARRHGDEHRPDDQLPRCLQRRQRPHLRRPGQRLAGGRHRPRQPVRRLWQRPDERR